MSSKNKKNDFEAAAHQPNVNDLHVDSESILREHRLRLRSNGRLISLRQPNSPNNNLKFDPHFLQQDHELIGREAEDLDHSINVWDDDWLEYLSTLKLLLIVFFLSIGFPSCTKLIEVDAPITSTNTSLVYATDAAATGVLTSIYSTMSEKNFVSGGITSMPLFTGLYSDELSLFGSVTNTSSIAYYTNNLSASITGSTDFWNNIYPIIFVANSALEGLTSSTTLTAAVKQQLLGEAKFIRAFCYLYLVNLYGDVPLVTTTNYKTNAILARTPVTQVYQQIFADLKGAEEQLSDSYVDGSLVAISSERTSPNRWAARALLARAYLYYKDYANAESYASLLINNNNLYDTASINDVFLKNSKEAIWQLQPVSTFVTNTWDGRIFGLGSAGPNTTRNISFLSPNFTDNFEPGDLRRSQWIKTVTVGTNTYYCAYKYKVITTLAPMSEYSMILRLTEQYLIRAEAKINQNRIADGIADLNVIRNRARAATTANVANPLPPLATDLSKENALAAVEHERQIELFTEWGHRWFDLKRMAGRIDQSKTRADEVLSVKKGNNWQSTDLLFPIPQTEIDKNPSLKGHQNPGYN